MEEEYRIIHEHPSEAQKILNQWKHEYDLEILSMSSFSNLNCTSFVTILIKRWKKS